MTVNRLVRFFTWSDELPSTSPEYVTARTWKTSDDIMPGATVLITAPTTDLNNRHQAPVPFRLGRVSTSICAANADLKLKTSAADYDPALDIATYNRMTDAADYNDYESNTSASKDKREIHYEKKKPAFLKITRTY
jgi:hypothetical protein